MSSYDATHNMLVSYFCGHGDTSPTYPTKQTLANCDIIVNSPDRSEIILIQVKHGSGQGKGKALAFAEAAIESLTQSTFEKLWSSFPRYEMGSAITDLIDNSFEASSRGASAIILDEIHQVDAAIPNKPTDEDSASHLLKLAKRLRQFARALVRRTYRWLFSLKKRLIQSLHLLSFKKQWQRRHYARALLARCTLSSDEDSHFFNLVAYLLTVHFTVKEEGISCLQQSNTLRVRFRAKTHLYTSLTHLSKLNSTRQLTR